MKTIARRSIDVVVSVLLLAISAPVWIVAAIAVKLDTPGPAIFRQTRIGRGGKRFTVLKLRSMYDPMVSASHPRSSETQTLITRTGTILRGTFIDELPQLINVLMGEMSIVGPRPEIPHIVEKYTPLQRRRLDVSPGITVLWQISDYRNDPIHENIKFDLYYVRHQSLKLDLRIMAATLFFLLDIRRIRRECHAGDSARPLTPGEVRSSAFDGPSRADARGSIQNSSHTPDTSMVSNKRY